MTSEPLFAFGYDFGYINSKKRKYVYRSFQIWYFNLTGFLTFGHIKSGHSNIRPSVHRFYEIRYSELMGLKTIGILNFNNNNKSFSVVIVVHTFGID